MLIKLKKENPERTLKRLFTDKDGKVYTITCNDYVDVIADVVNHKYYEVKSDESKKKKKKESKKEEVKEVKEVKKKKRGKKK